MMDTSFENGEEICCHDGVILKKADNSFSSEIENIGTLSLLKHNSKTFYIEWKQNRFLIADSDSQEQGDWSIVDKIARRNRTESETLIFNTSTNVVFSNDSLSYDQRDSRSSPINGFHNTITSNSNKSKTVQAKLNDIKYIELLYNNNEIRLVNKIDDRVHSQYFFQQRNADNFLRNLLSLGITRQYSRNKRIYYTIDEKDLEINSSTVKTFESLNISDIKNSKGGGSVLNDIIEKFAGYMPPMTGPMSVYSETTLASTSNTDQEMNHHNTSAEEYEVLNDNETNNVYDPLENEIKDLENKLVSRRKFIRGTCLTDKIWKELQSEDGRITDADKVREIVFRGGIENSLRRELWKYLLDYEPWEMNRTERKIHYDIKKDEYFQMKLQWKSITKVQEENFSGYRDRKCQIEKDVKRTDRAELFFAGDNNPNLDLLQDILMTYVMYNFDLGYVQGMSDLLAPILSVMKNEHDSFWCFVGFMKKVFSNFDMDQAGMKTQLHQLSRLVSFACPRLYYYLKETSSDNMFFCFRWLLVWFKREFSHIDIMELWEVLWTGLPCANYHLIICVAILEMQMETFIDNKFEFNDILKHINELSMKISLRECLQNAESIYNQIKESPHLTDELRIIIGEEPIERYDNNLDDENHVNLETIRISTSSSIGEEEEKKLEEACEISMNYSFL